MTKIINLPKIRIVGDLHNHRIYLDDIDISRFVNRIAFVMDALEGIPRVELTIVALPDIPENLSAVVVAEEIDVEEIAREWSREFQK